MVGDDLLKPIVTSLEIDYSAELSDDLLQKIHDFTLGVDAPAGIPSGDGRSRRNDDPAPYVSKLVQVSFSGDTTAYPGWHERVGRFVDDSRLAVSITSSFARNFDDEDLLSLNKVHQIRVSIDSSSPAMMEKLRSVDLRAVIANIVRLRQTMLEAGKKTELHVDCTVTRDSITHLGGVARLASLLQVDALNIGDATDSPTSPNVRDTLQDLSNAEARLLALSLIDAVNALKETATKINVRASLKNKLEPVLVAMSEGRPVSAESFRASGDPGTNSGPCVRPWDTAFVQATGNVKLCRGPLEAVGNLHNDSLIDLVNGSFARRLRATLLDAGPDLPCKACALSTSDTPDAFLEKVRRAHEQYDATIEPWQAALPTGMDYDATHGINTQAKIFLSELDPEQVGTALQHANHYLPTAVENIDRILDAIPLVPEQCTLIDLGCGMGRVLLHAAKRPFRQIIGVEVSPALLEIAKKNVNAYKDPLACRDIVLVRADAAEFTFPSGDIVVYMYNPFTDVVLRPVLERLSRHEGRVVIAYHGPLHAALIDGNPRFVAVNRFALADPRQTCRVWQSRS